MKLKLLKVISGVNGCNLATRLHLYRTFYQTRTYSHAAWPNCSDYAILSLQGVETVAIKDTLRFPCFVFKRYCHQHSGIEPLLQYALKFALKYLKDTE